MRKRLASLLFLLARATVYPLTKNIEWLALKRRLDRVDYPHTVGRYLAMMVVSAFVAAVLGAVATAAGFATGVFFSPLFAVLPLVAFFGTLAAYALWPWLALSMKRRRIASNLPLAILTMGTVAQSGAPPQQMFDVIAHNPDYPYLGKECAKLKRFMNLMGLSFSEAIQRTADITPSPEFRRFLKELNTTLRSGGDLRSFMAKRAEDAYFEYTMRLEQAAKSAETMGDVYSILMIAAPIFLFLAVMLVSVFAGGGEIMGFEINFLLSLAILGAIPAVNTAFLVYMELTAAE